MPSQFLRETAPTPSAIVLADTTDFGSGGHGLTRTDQIDLTGLASGAYRQSASFDLSANPAPAYYVRGAFEYTGAPGAGELVTVSFGWSTIDAATNYPANLSGSDSAYTGYSSDADDAIQQLTTHLSRPLTAVADIHILDFGLIVPLARHGICVVGNHTATQAMNATDAQEMFVHLIPVVIESQ